MKLFQLTTKSSSRWVKASIAVLICTSTLFQAHAQEKTAAADEKVYTSVEQSAQFPGGLNAFYQFLAKNIRYPAGAREKKVQGKVFLKFTVEKDGSLSNLHVLREPGSGLGDEALRVMKQSPKWTPGKEKGRVVREEYTVPISFSLKA